MIVVDRFVCDTVHTKVRATRHQEET